MAAARLPFHSYLYSNVLDKIKKPGPLIPIRLSRLGRTNYTGMTGEVVMRLETRSTVSPVPVVEIIPKSENNWMLLSRSKFLKMIPIDQSSVPLSETGSNGKLARCKPFVFK